MAVLQIVARIVARPLAHRCSPRSTLTIATVEQGFPKGLGNGAEGHVIDYLESP